jgi:hypothetical protein
LQPGKLSMSACVNLSAFFQAKAEWQMHTAFAYFHVP